MSAVAAIQAPISYGPAIELASRMWEKRILPVGSIDYKGRTLRFTPSYLQSLVEAFQDGAYDQVPLQLADASNTHTNDPERTAGWIEDLELRDDGLYALAQVTDRGERVLSENPRLGVSARIVEQYARSDGKHYPAAIQHVLGTLDPRIPALGSWSPVDMSGDADIVIDLSQSTFAADADELTDAEIDELVSQLTDDDLAALDGSGGGELSDEELADLIDGLEDGGDDDELAALVDSLTDEELAGLEAEALADGDLDGYGQAELAEFGAQFSNTYAAEQARQRQDAEPAIRRATGTSPTEDRLARAFERIAAGTYTPSYGLANQRIAVELANAGGACGAVDVVTGRCAAPYHMPDCRSYLAALDDDGIQLASSGAYPDVHELAVELVSETSTGTGPAFIETTNPYGGSVEVPAGYLELAHSLNEEWGLHTGTSALGWDDLLGPSYGGDAYSDLAREIGRPDLAVPQPQPGRLDVSAIRAGLGL